MKPIGGWSSSPLWWWGSSRLALFWRLALICDNRREPVHTIFITSPGDNELIWIDYRSQMWAMIGPVAGSISTQKRLRSEADRWRRCWHYWHGNRLSSATHALWVPELISGWCFHLFCNRTKTIVCAAGGPSTRLSYPLHCPNRPQIS